MITDTRHPAFSRIPEHIRVAINLAGQYAGPFEGDEKNIRFIESLNKAGFELFPWPGETFPPEDMVSAPQPPFPSGPSAWAVAGVVVVLKGFQL